MGILWDIISHNGLLSLYKITVGYYGTGWDISLLGFTNGHIKPIDPWPLSEKLLGTSPSHNPVILRKLRLDP